MVYSTLKRYYPGVFLSIIITMLLSARPYKYKNVGIQQDEPAMTLEVYNKRITNTNKAVLVYFSAGWCAVCPKFKPVITEIEKEYSGKIEILKIDTDKDIEIAKEFEVNTLPLLILYKNGKKEWINSGIIPIVDIRRAIECYL